MPASARVRALRASRGASSAGGVGIARLVAARRCASTRARRAADARSPTAPVPQPAPAHPNGVVAIDHVVAASPDLDRSVAALQAAGLDLRRVREEPTPAGAPRQAFFRLGRRDPRADPGARGGGRARRRARAPGALLGSRAARRGPRSRAEQLGEQVGEVRPAVQPGRRIATVRRSAGLAVPLALMSRADAARGGRASERTSRWNDGRRVHRADARRRGPALEARSQTSADAGLPAIALTPAQGKLLHLLARIHGARSDPRGRHARRLQHDLARPRAARRRPSVTLELEPALRRGGQPRTSSGPALPAS